MHVLTKFPVDDVVAKWIAHVVEEIHVGDIKVRYDIKGDEDWRQERGQVEDEDGGEDLDRRQVPRSVSAADVCLLLLMYVTRNVPFFTRLLSALTYCAV